MPSVRAANLFQAYFNIQADPAEPPSREESNSRGQVLLRDACTGHTQANNGSGLLTDYVLWDCKKCNLHLMLRGSREKQNMYQLESFHREWVGVAE